MDHDTRTTSFEKGAIKTKDVSPKIWMSPRKQTPRQIVRFFQQEMKELKRFCPRRRPLRFDQVDQNHTDEFYESQFSNLIGEINTLVSIVFCPGSKVTNPVSSPWLQQHSKEFISYVELVARPDPLSGSWERLLRDDIERNHLLQATIMKILDAQVFSSLLFGADPEHRNMLESTDASLVRTEGFRRSDLRAHTNRLYLEAKRGQPPIFWDEVDKLCAQVLALLLPMYTWTSETKGWHPPSIKEFCQLLHEVIAYAGWLNICIRLSPSVIAFDWVKPGERYHGAQVNASQEAYEFSKESVNRYERRIKSRGITGNRKRIARVKISMVPKITRFKLAVDACGTEGMETYDILKAHVVCYHGRQLDHDNDKTYVGLSGYIRRLRDRNTASHSTALFIMLLAIIWWWVKFQPSGQDAWRSIWQGLSPTSEMGPWLK